MFEVRGVNALAYGPVETARATPEGGGGGNGGAFPPPPRPPANNPPMADPGPDQTSVREGALVTLDGSSDPDDDPLKYRWKVRCNWIILVASSLRRLLTLVKSPADFASMSNGDSPALAAFGITTACYWLGRRARMSRITASTSQLQRQAGIRITSQPILASIRSRARSWRRSLPLASTW